jgi:hypothetical protein
MSVDRQLKDLCTGRWTGLNDTFGDLLVRDLAVLTDQDIRDLVSDVSEPKLRQLARVFLRTVKAEITKKAEDTAGSPEQSQVLPYVLSRGILSCSQRVCSANFAVRRVDTMVVTDLANLIQSLVESGVLNGVHTLDVSQCSLADADLPHVLRAVKECKSFKRIDLSANNLHGHDATDRVVFNQFMHEMLKNKIFVDITENPAATVDRLDLYRAELSAQELRYLVWLPVSHLDQPFWHDVMRPRVAGDDREAIAAVIEAHTEYYSFVYVNEDMKHRIAEPEALLNSNSSRITDLELGMSELREALGAQHLLHAQVGAAAAPPALLSNERAALELRSVTCELANFIAEEIGLDPWAENIRSWHDLEECVCDEDDLEERFEAKKKDLSIGKNEVKAIQALARSGVRVAHQKITLSPTELKKAAIERKGRGCEAKLSVIDIWSRVRK